jgi:hypothetical protein
VEFFTGAGPATDKEEGSMGVGMEVGGQMA